MSNNEVPKLNFKIVPPAGMPSSHSSRSVRLRQQFEAVHGGIFSPERPMTVRKRRNLSQREEIALKHDKEKYNTWLSKWEKDTNIGRYLMLRNLVKKCQGFSKAQLDEVYGNSSELVFMHIFIFVRWNCRTTCSVAIQLKALRVFFEASSGFCFVEHFLKKGGTETLLTFLSNHKELSDEDLVELLNTFMALTGHGQHAISYILDTDFTSIFLSSIPDFTSDEVHTLTMMLFIQLADGCHQYKELFCNALRDKFILYRSDVKALYTASHIFRILFDEQLAAECDIKNQINDFLILSLCESLEVQYEGITILIAILEQSNHIRRRFIFTVLYDLIVVNIDDLPITEVDNKLRQQTFSIKLLNTILSKNSNVVESLFEMIHKFLPALVRALGNTENYSAQKFASHVICGLVDYNNKTKIYMENAVPKDWVTALLQAPSKFCLELTPTQIDTFISIDPTDFYFENNIDLDVPKFESISQRLIKGNNGYNQRKLIITPITNVKSSIVMRDTMIRFNPVTTVKDPAIS